MLEGQPSRALYELLRPRLLIQRICLVGYSTSSPFFLFAPGSAGDASPMLTRITATIFKDSIWTYVEPTAGILSACLPYLANIFGRRILQVVQFVSDFGSKTKSLLRLYSRTEDGTRDTNTADRETHRATHEAYELNNSGNDMPAFKDRDLSQESVRNLV